MKRNGILIFELISVWLLSSCTGPTPLDAGKEAPLKTLAGRESYLAEEYEGAKILSEIKIEETGFIISEFAAEDIHSFVFFRPTDYGYAYNGDAHGTLDGMVTEAYAPLGDGMYYVFLRHDDAIVSLDVTRINGETNEIVQNGIVTFEEGDIALMKQEDELPHWRMRIVAYDKEGREYVLAAGDPSEEPLPDVIEMREREKDREFIRFLSISIILIIINEIRRRRK